MWPRYHDLAIGLPPRTRGSLRLVRQSDPLGGSTPAYAGITRWHSRSSRTAGVYPRVRGDHPWRSDNPVNSWGLPPRTRGSLLEMQHGVMPPRSTPAYAGITWPPAALRCSPRVYPRVRGDHAWRAFLAALDEGLPPRTRGSLEAYNEAHAARRSTPAYAGITNKEGAEFRVVLVYPRVRGDHLFTPGPIARTIGLPPRTRGSRPARSPCR